MKQVRAATRHGEVWIRSSYDSRCGLCRKIIKIKWLHSVKNNWIKRSLFYKLKSKVSNVGVLRGNLQPLKLLSVERRMSENLSFCLMLAIISGYLSLDTFRDVCPRSLRLLSWYDFQEFLTKASCCRYDQWGEWAPFNQVYSPHVACLLSLLVVSVTV